MLDAQRTQGIHNGVDHSRRQANGARFAKPLYAKRVQWAGALRLSEHEGRQLTSTYLSLTCRDACHARARDNLTSSIYASKLACSSTEVRESTPHERDARLDE